MNKSKRLTCDDSQQDVPVPEHLPAGGSAAEERLRAAQHEEGRAPARAGAETTRSGEKGR